MARRIAGTICLASSLMMILWIATGATASGFVKFSLLGIVGSILALYKWDDLAALLSPTGTVAPETEVATDGVFGTELPPEAFAEPVPETKAVNLTSRTQIFKQLDPSEGSVLLAEHPELSDSDSVVVEVAEEALEDVEPGPQPEDDLAQAEAGETTTELARTNGAAPAVVASEPVFIQLADYSDDELVQSVRAGEASLVAVLTESGMLSTEGPVTDIDVATMVFVAVSSDDLLRTLIQSKEAEEQAAALAYQPNTPQLYEPAPQLVEPRS